MTGGYVYILASKRNGTLYVGVTARLSERVAAHKSKTGSKFTSKYGVARLVYLERYDRIQDAIIREKQLKNWRRSWKLQLIERQNSDWTDLSFDLHGIG